MVDRVGVKDQILEELQRQGRLKASARRDGLPTHRLRKSHVLFLVLLAVATT